MNFLTPMGEGHNSTHNSPSFKQNNNKKYTYKYEMKKYFVKDSSKTMISETRQSAVFIIDYWQLYIMYKILK